MIYGHISAKETEKAYAPRILEAIRYCRETDVSHMGESRFLLDGDRLIAQICDRVTEAKEKKLPEVHRRYAELQYMAEGRELMGYYPCLLYTSFRGGTDYDSGNPCSGEGIQCSCLKTGQKRW